MVFSYSQHVLLVLADLEIGVLLLFVELRFKFSDFLASHLRSDLEVMLKINLILVKLALFFVEFSHKPNKFLVAKQRVLSKLVGRF